MDPARPDTAAVLRAFRHFARQPVEVDAPEDDAVLFEVGTYSPPISPFERRAFTLSLTRQLCVSEEGEHGHMEHVRCVIGFEPSEALAAHSGNVWSDDFDGLGAFFEHVAGSEAYRAALRHEPFGLVAQQYQVWGQPRAII